MSFARDVKKEISNIEASIDDYKAELYGITKLKANYIISSQIFSIEFVTNNISLARRIVFLLKKVYEVSVELLSKEQNKLDYKKLYYIIVKDKAKEILFDLEIINENYEIISEVSRQFHNDDAILRGMFLAKGSVNDPYKSNYHLEIVCNHQAECDFIFKVLNKFGLLPKIVNRKKGLVVYLKKSEQIGDFLKIIGAINMMFDFENQRIKRDLNNVVNRVLNCDMANSDRTQLSALRQLENIKIIEENYGVDNLSQRLKEAMLLRKTYPDYSLSELSEQSEDTIGRYLSKSGLSHCFKDLENIALSIKK